MFLIILLLIVALIVETLALLLLFRHHMVDLTKWHELTHALAATAMADAQQMRQWLQDHLHLHTAPSVPAAAPPPAAKR